MAASSGLSLAALERLVLEPHTCVTRVSRETHLALAPSNLADLAGGVAEHFSSHINRYYPALQGILLGYNRPRLTARTAHLLHDQPYIHLDVRADFFVFTPSRGCVLSGVVNKKSSDHLGCLVHDTFNVSLVGRRAEQEGEVVRIEVTSLSYGRDSLPLLQGRLVKGGEAGYDSGIEVKLEDGGEARKRKSEEGGEEVEGKRARLDVETGGDGEVLVKKNKKKKEKDKVKEEPLSEPEIKQEPDAESYVKKKKKKKDKHKD